jgi:predicted permease
MAWLHRRIFRLPTTRARLASEIDDELRYHLETRTAELIAAGSTPDEAWRRAAREFGDLGAARAELTRVDQRRLGRQRRADVIDVIGQDLRYAWRGLGRQPGFAAIVVLTLALAVGANSAVFSLVDPLLFRTPAGVSDPGSLRRLYVNRPRAGSAASAGIVGNRFSYGEYRAIRGAVAGRARVAAYITRDSVPLVQNGDTTFGHVGYATADFLPLLGVRPDLGRLFTDQDDQVEHPANVAVVTPEFARRMFGDHVRPLGRVFDIRGRQFTVVGVLHPGFTGIDVAGSDLWAPFSTDRPAIDPDAHGWFLRGESFIKLVARLEPGLTDAAFDAVATRADHSAWQTDEPTLQHGRMLTGSIIDARGPAAPRQEVSISSRLAVVSLLVLLIACANVANLLLLRTAARRREIAVRLALGVSKLRLMSQLLSETLLLALIAGIVALWTAWWAGNALRTALLPRINWVGSPLTNRVFAFTAALTVIAGCLVAVAPMMLARRRDFGSALAVGARDGFMMRSRTRSALLCLQVALSIVLVAGAGLFVRSLRKVENVPLGVDSQHLVVALVHFSDRKAHPEISTLIPPLTAKIAKMSNVAAAAYGSGAPLLTSMEGSRLISGSGGASLPYPSYNEIGPGYFDAAGTQLLQGRAFGSSDVAGNEPVMIVSKRTAERLWSGQNALGKCARVDSPDAACMRIVGVVEDAHQFDFTEEWSPQFYVPLAQSRDIPWALTIRAKGRSAPAVADAVRDELRHAFPGSTITSRTAADILEPRLRPWTLGAQLFASMGLLSLIVAAIGLYGVVAFAVQQRNRELGIRVALGARNTDLLRTVARHSISPVLGGVVAGTLITLAASRFVASLLYGVSPRDPASIAAAAAALLVAAVLASLAPARRAVQVDPIKALREE